MQSFVKLTIDGVNVRAGKGTTVLEAALNHGFCIPHLCNLPAIEGIGGCRLCIVEHVRNGYSQVTAACRLRVQEGMRILVSTPRIRHMRKNVAELLVAEAPNSRAVQDIAVRCGVTSVRYPFRNEECVLCGRCVQISNETCEGKAFGFVGRGSKRRVDFPFGKRPDSCSRCTACLSYCPTAFAPCIGPFKKGEERLCGGCESQTQVSESDPTTCVYCELGKGFQCTRQLEGMSC